MIQTTASLPVVDIAALKAQVDSEIAAKLEAEADYARYVHRRGLHAGGLKLLVGMAAVSEVTELPPLFRLPGAPVGVKGLANRHGRVVPVIDLPSLYGPVLEPPVNAWLLVYGRGDEAVGIIVDNLPDRKRFNQGDAVDLAEVTHPIVAHAQAAYREDGDIWIDMDMESLFASVFHVDSSDSE